MQYYTTTAKAQLYESVIDVFESLFKEVRDLSKKKPDGALSKSKIHIINRVLEDARKLLADEAESKYLDLIDEDLVPQLGDAVLILSQYEGALKSFREKHFGYDASQAQHTWLIQKKK